MTKRIDCLPRYAPGEERFNAASHGVGAVLACAGMGALLFLSIRYGDLWAVTASAVYGSSLIALYLASALYHASVNPGVKSALQVLDHCSIFLLIAGTYTPYTLITLRGPLGWGMFALIWAAAAGGIALNLADMKKYSRASMVCYLAMGWVVLAAIRPLVRALDARGVALLALGGLAYTGGVVFYKSKRRYMHVVWHLFVLAGSALHYCSILLYVIPSTF